MLDTVEKVLEFTSGGKLLTKDNSIFMCVVAQNNNDDCNYAICETCEGEHKSKKRYCIVDREGLLCRRTNRMKCWTLWRKYSSSRLEKKINKRQLYFHVCGGSKRQ